MELFRETLEKTLNAKRQELSAFKKTSVIEEIQSASSESPVTVTVTATTTTTNESEGTNASVRHPPLDYSVSKVVQTIRTFEAERLKKSKRAKALKDTTP